MSGPHIVTASSTLFAASSVQLLPFVCLSVSHSLDSTDYKFLVQLTMLFPLYVFSIDS